MTFGRVAEALPRAIRLVGWPKLVIFFYLLLMIGSRSLGTPIPQRAGAPVFKVKDGALFIAGGGDALDTICYMADDTTEEYLQDVCHICKTYLPGQPILSFSPSRESYAHGHYSDVQISACELCIQNMFKAVKEANYKRE